MEMFTLVRYIIIKSMVKDIYIMLQDRNMWVILAVEICMEKEFYIAKMDKLYLMENGDVGNNTIFDSIFDLCLLIVIYYY